MTKVSPYMFWFCITFFLCFSVSIFAGQYKKIYFFGDSITDSGNHPRAPFTNNNGSIWSVILARLYGIDLEPSLAGGTNYAWAGAQTNGEVLPYLVPSIKEQVAELIRLSPKLDNQSLYIIWGGHNDFFNFLYGSGNSPNVTASNIRDLTTVLHLHGAKNIVVNNICDLGVLPAFANSPMLAAIYSSITDDFNLRLLDKLNHLTFDVLQLNLFGMSKALLNNPTKYGFRSDAATLVYVEDSTDGLGYIFFSDGVHLTTQAHQFVSDYVSSVLTAANFYATIANSTIPIIQAYNAHLQQQLLANTCRRNIQWIPFVSLSYAPELQNANSDHPRVNYHQDALLGAIGIKLCINSSVWGLAYGHSENDLEFKQAGDLHSNTNFFSLFTSQRHNRFYLNGLVDIAWFDFENINRRFKLGNFLATTQGNTMGLGYAAQFSSGYQFIQKPMFSTGPVVKVEYDKIHIQGFTESGSEEAALVTYNHQKFDNFISGLGWDTFYQARIKGRPIQSHVEILANQQWGSDQRDIHYHLTSLPGSHGLITVPNPRGSFVSGSVSLRTRFRNGIDLGLNYAALVGEHHLNQQWILTDINFLL